MSTLNKRIDQYQRQYLTGYNHSFEKTMVWARQKYIVSFIESHNPEIIIEIGCGSDQLFDQVRNHSSLKQWIIIEPSEMFVTMARETFADDARVEIIHGFVEQVSVEIDLQQADLCICSGLLHEVENPEVILSSARKLLKPDGRLHVNVPNAKSFHRMLAKSMGLVKSEYQMSDRNKLFSQFHVFDLEMLIELIEKSGFSTAESGGYFIKPFAHHQMEKISEIIDPEVMEGLWNMGVSYPGLASEIFVNARVQ